MTNSGCVTRGWSSPAEILIQLLLTAGTAPSYHSSDPTISCTAILKGKKKKKALGSQKQQQSHTTYWHTELSCLPVVQEMPYACRLSLKTHRTCGEVCPTQTQEPTPGHAQARPRCLRCSEMSLIFFTKLTQGMRRRRNGHQVPNLPFSPRPPPGPEQ